jgi:hypothetical protein
MRRNPFALGLSLLGVAGAAVIAGGAAASAAASVAALGETLAEGGYVRERRGKGQRNRRGKRAARRHGAKLRPNMRTVSKRVRRKHRKAKRK